MNEILKIKDLKVYYPVRSGILNRVTDNVLAVDGVDLSIAEGETAGLVGESGSGKSTIGKAIVGLEQMTSGEMIYKGQDVSKKTTRRHLKYNKEVQMIFQDALSSLNPRKNIYDIIAEPIRNFEQLDPQAERKRIESLLDIVSLPRQTLSQFPFQFSGGQRQRIGIARAVATNPKLIIADEPVSALDLSVQAQVLNFMKQIQKDMGIAFLFISHDLGVVRHMTDNIAVMHRGRIVEKGTREDIFEGAKHIYTKRLLSAIPSIDVSKREENRARRLAIEKEFEVKKSEYYDAEGKAFPLQKINATHWVALPAKEKGESLCGR